MPARIRSTHLLAPLLAPLLAALALACFEPPELDDPLPPIPDLAAVDTWTGIEDAGPPEGEDGFPADPSADSGAEDAGAEDADSDSGSDTGAESADPALAQLLITEVLVDPDGKDGGPDSPEFVELTNPGPLPVSLDGIRVSAASWPVVDAAKVGLESQVLEPGEILVIRRWATDSDPSLASLEFQAPVLWAGFLHSGGLRNDDGSVAIEAGTTSIDQVIYGIDPTEPSTGWTDSAVSAPGSGESLCRVDGPDQNSAVDWAPCNPNPGVLGLGDGGGDGGGDALSIAQGAVQIIEVSANPPWPASEENPYEFVEIVNTSEDQLELSGCRIGDDASIDAPGLDPLGYISGDGGCESPTCLAPGKRAIIVGQGYLGETGGALVLAVDDTTIANSGLTNTEPVVLWDALDTMVSSYRLWNDPAEAPLPSDEQPLHRIQTDAADEPQSWISAPPSPGIL